MSETLNAAQYRETVKKEKHGRIFRSPKADRTVDGKIFDSKAEAKRYMTLRFAEIAGNISQLECQVIYDLHVNGEKIGRYIADFGYLSKTGELVVEDVKCTHTRKDPLYRWKAKHMRAQYGIVVKEILG